MNRKLIPYLTAFVVFLIAATCVATDFFEEFEANYKVLDQDLLNNMGEVAAVSNFVYQKDVSTFTLKEGTIHLLRYVHGRPTTAIFIGQGHASITIPSHTERQGLLKVAGDSTVDEDFEILFVRMADDFDLKLKEQFTFEQQQLDWKMFQPAKQAQGELFFKSNIHHPRDNYFQLLRSLYKRAQDGYFWADFNRWVFSYDPNRPECIEVAYEYQGGDILATVGAKFQQQENKVYDDLAMSNIPYATTIVSKTGDLYLSGTDGRRIDMASTTVKMAINADSLRFLSMYLQFNLNLDSVLYKEKRLNFIRRKTFEFFGLILPEYVYQGDTIELNCFYHGTNFDHFMPYVDNPAPCLHNLTFTVPKGYNYYMPGMSKSEKINGKQIRFTSSSPALYSKFFFHAYAGGIEDTIPVVSDIGMTLNFLSAKHIKKRQQCYITHEKYRQSITDAFNYFSATFGPPPNTFVEYIIPEGFQSMPGMIKSPQLACVTEGGWAALGGYDFISGNAVARQWFGSTMRPATNREKWTTEALPEYMCLMFLQSHIKGGTYYTNIYARRDSLYTAQGLGRDLPLVIGDRVNTFTDEDSQDDYLETIRANKGIWMLHMLRFLMYDLETGSEVPFIKFLQRLFLLVNNKTYTNADIVALAEKYYGEKLDWLFDHWLYGVDFPTFKVTYSIEQRDGKFYMPIDVTTENVEVNYSQPVILRVKHGDGSSTFKRETISGTGTHLELGPYDIKPEKLVFNEFFSVLSRDDVTRK
ncbi:MAG: hypothetical protein DRP47_04165 [Candidatus Zixiibacteriota bacterium]|nr:MAG: hypothetical protein DRP47_04165 [candidate division Zixibacteria bacterium]